jgi:hypothetical protein
MFSFILIGGVAANLCGLRAPPARLRVANAGGSLAAIAVFS